MFPYCFIKSWQPCVFSPSSCRCVDLPQLRLQHVVEAALGPAAPARGRFASAQGAVACAARLAEAARLTPPRLPKNSSSKERSAGGSKRRTRGENKFRVSSSALAKGLDARRYWFQKLEVALCKARAICVCYAAPPKSSGCRGPLTGLNPRRISFCQHGSLKGPTPRHLRSRRCLDSRRLGQIRASRFTLLKSVR